MYEQRKDDFLMLIIVGCSDKLAENL